MKKTTILVLSLFVLSFSFLFGAEDTTKNKSKISQEQKTKKIAAGPHYWRTGFAKFFLGKDYRNLWTLPIELEILNLKNEAGGLSPVMTVGGQQTKGLALKGADGQTCLEKNPGNPSLKIEIRFLPSMTVCCCLCFDSPFLTFLISRMIIREFTE